MKQNKIRKLKLAKPIHTIIKIEIVHAFCKMGYTQSAGILVVNNDWDNAIVQPLNSASISYTLFELKHKMFKKFVGFEKYRNVTDTNLFDAGVYVNVTQTEVKMRKLQSISKIWSKNYGN